jgi:hypothetical protein
VPILRWIASKPRRNIHFEVFHVTQGDANLAASVIVAVVSGHFHMIPLGWRGASPNSLRAACAVADGMDSLGTASRYPKAFLCPRIWRSRSQSILRSIQIAPNGGRSKNGSLFGDGSSDRHLIRRLEGALGVYLRDNILDLLVSFRHHLLRLLADLIGAANRGPEQRVQCRAHFRKMLR